MAYEQKEGRGSLFKNTRKQNDKHADYNGSIKIEGREYWLNAWLKQSANGTKYMSLSAKPKEATQGAQPENASFDDDIPWN